MTGETPGINTPSLAMAEVMSGQSVQDHGVSILYACHGDVGQGGVW